MSIPSIHRYPFRSLLPDYLRGGAGLVIGAGGLLLAPSVVHVIVIFGGLTGLFLLFTIRTALRQWTWIELTEDAISVGQPRRETLRWDQLSHVKLRYYSTRRNRTGGWMALTLASTGQRIAVDSNIDGFDAIAARAAHAAMANRLELDEITQTNLAALGLVPAPDAPMTSEAVR
jgi:hypothetical protein